MIDPHASHFRVKASLLRTNLGMNIYGQDTQTGDFPVRHAKRLLGIMGLVVCICCGPFQLIANPANLLLVASFDEGMDADYAAGDPEARHHDSLTLQTGGRSENALLIKPFEWFRFSTKGNISFEEGALSIWVKPSPEINTFKEDYSNRIQYIACSRIRSGATFALYIQPEKELLVAELASDRDHIGKVSLPIKLSGNKNWRHILVAWKQPGTIYLNLDGVSKEVVVDQCVPSLDSALMYDLFLGSNAKQILKGPYGEIGYFDGLIDDLSLYDRYLEDVEDAEFQVNPLSEKPDIESAEPRWVGSNRKRLNVFLAETKRKWERVPVDVPVDFSSEYSKFNGEDRRAFIDGIRLVRYDVKTGEPMVYDKSESGENKYFVPFQVRDELYWSSKGSIRFSHEGELPAAYSIYYDEKSAYTDPFPREFPLVGNGERLRVGEKGGTGQLAGTIRGYLQFWDADEDGDLDLWFSHGDMKQQCDEFLSGHYYYENVGSSKDPLFAPPQLIFRDSTPYGEIHRTCAPQLIDCNDDGKRDLFIFNEKLQVWAEFELVAGRPRITEWSKVIFSGTLPKGERGRLFDWDGDGRLDLLFGERVFLNQTQDGVPTFSEEHFRALNDNQTFNDKSGVFGDALKMSMVGGFDVPLDFDRDGDVDILSEGFISKVFLHENKGRNQFASPQLVQTHAGHELMIPGVFPAPTMADIDGDGDQDLLWSNDQAVVGWNENIAFEGSSPVILKQTRFLQVVNPFVDAGALAIPLMTDWDDDGDLDIISGASDEYLYFFENTGTATKPRFSGPERMQADSAPIVIRAGSHGSIRGAQENDWAYLNPEVVDWDGDGLDDLILVGVQGVHYVYENVGYEGDPRLSYSGPINVEWKNGPQYSKWLRFKPSGNEFIGMQRTRPAAVDWNRDGVMDLVTLNHKNKLALFLGNQRGAENILSEGQELFTFDRPHAHGLYLVRPEEELNWVSEKAYGHYTGRTVTNLVDWDRDGDFDLVWDNVNGRLYENVGSNDKPHFVDRGDLVRDRIVRHNTGPDVVDVDGDGWDDLICGAETGRIFYYHRAYIEGDVPEIYLLNNRDLGIE